MSDILSWGSELKEIDITLYEQLQEKTIVELLNELDTIAPGDKILDRKRYTHILAVIADRLTVPLRAPIGSLIQDLFGDLNDRVDELEKIFKNHRHDTSKSYSEKPAW